MIQRLSERVTIYTGFWGEQAAQKRGMHMLIEISVLIMAIAVVVLVVFLIQTLREAQASIQTANETLRETKELVHQSKEDVQELMKGVSELIHQVNQQVGAVEPLMSSVRNVGTAVNEVTAAAKEASAAWSGSLKRQAALNAEKASAISSWLNWLDTAARTYQTAKGLLEQTKRASNAAAKQQFASASAAVDNKQRG
ncbi:DUF948 domain-containing protein [Paenibacillus sp. GCM10012307]